MQKHFSHWSKAAIIFIALIFLINTKYIFALTLQEEAEKYREQGYKAQQTGDMDQAISWYQKAASMDMNYAAPHNDLGILFEAKGWLDRAGTEYQKAISIDPNYAKAHTNLALLYERKGELEKAAFHWMRRYKLGTPGDPWTEEARQRLEKLGLVEKAEGRKTALPKTEQASEERASSRPVKAIEPKQDSVEWTRLGSKPEAIEEKQIPVKRPVPVIKERPKQKEYVKVKPEKKKLERPVKARVKKPRDEPASEWTLIGSGPEVAEKRERTRSMARKTTQVSSRKRTDIDRELQESLRLAEERLRQERGKKTESRTIARPAVTQPEVSSGARSYYVKAGNYFEKGEYSRALDTIRAGKREYPDDQALLKLEETIKNKMKEERIKDHYDEGLMRYNESNFSGARKEFEAILNILPE